jgi:hypothetical protein
VFPFSIASEVRVPLPGAAPPSPGALLAAVRRVLGEHGFDVAREVSGTLSLERDWITRRRAVTPLLGARGAAVSASVERPASGADTTGGTGGAQAAVAVLRYEVSVAPTALDVLAAPVVTAFLVASWLGWPRRPVGWAAVLSGAAALWLLTVLLAYAATAAFFPRLLRLACADALDRAAAGSAPRGAR